MIRNNNRNSRDDKSTPGNRDTSNRRPSGTESSYKGKSSFGDKEGKEGGYKGRKPFGDKEGGAGSFGGAGRSSTGRTENTGNYKGGSRTEGGSSYKGASRTEGSSTYKGAGRTEGGSSYKGGSRNEGSSTYKGAGRTEGGSSYKGGSRTEGGSTYKGKRTFGENESRDNKFSGAGRSGASRPETGSSYKGKRPFENKEGQDAGEKTRSYIKKDQFAPKGDQPAKRFEDRKGGASRSTDSRPFRKRDAEGGEYRPSFSSERPVMRVRKDQPKKADDGLIRLNRYIANSGICSRRKADELIAAGVVSVNGIPISELGHKIDPAKDEIRYNGELLKREKKTYVLLNKPKDYITTTEDPQERKTVMQLVEKASRERIYPVGRLDRNTTGLLLMTNDGDLADKLSHPRNGITKIYHVELDKSLSQGDMNKIQFGLELEDGLIKPDTVSYVTGGSKREVGIQIHSGKNRIVRRIFEHLGYEVVKLDRVVYGNLTKKDLPRGRWRYLEEHELIQIKHLIK
jgi:23S rRNA pseudouridine2605 synthase